MSKLDTGKDYFDVDYSIYRDKDNANYLILETLIICGVVHRYKGEGTKALNRIIGIAKENNCKYIELNADTKQRQAPGFVLVEWYKKFGFVETGAYGWMHHMKLSLC